MRPFSGRDHRLQPRGQKNRPIYGLGPQITPSFKNEALSIHEKGRFCGQNIIFRHPIHEKGRFCGQNHKKKTLRISPEGLTRLAATYFPTWYSSIIGTNGLNFSVRYGKRWIPIVITTIVFFSYDAYSICTTVFYINERETCQYPIGIGC